LDTTCRNPFKSIIIRAVETLYALDEALRIIDSYEEPDDPATLVVPSAGEGMAATEAPRGLLFHRYRLEADGIIVDAQIVPPTSQNQATIEDDLASFIGDVLDRSQDEIRHLCEQTIRNYDPCISCATHFLKLDIVRN
jgi:coenzyme F420-reducing hydrogenase alpha subunit